MRIPTSPYSLKQDSLESLENGLDRNVSSFCIAGITKESHLLVHCAADRASPGKIRATANDGNSDECENSKEKTEEEPRLNFALLSVGNEG